MENDDPRQLRLATPSDIPALRQLIEVSVRSLSVGYYTEPQIESALRYVFGPDTQLIADQTYYVIEDGIASDLIGAGGWSRRRTLYGGDQMKLGADPLLNPKIDAARLRAFFVHPEAARCGLGRRLFNRCETNAIQIGFQRFELMATLPGERFYLALGFVPLDRPAVTLPDGEILKLVSMARPLSEARNQDEVLIGGPERRPIEIVDYDPTWPAKFNHHALTIREALGPIALRIEHIGSTSVPGLAAKPIIDIVVVVPDSADEPSYLPYLEAAGYELRVRESDFHEHRMFRTKARDVHIHVYSLASPEISRILTFRDRLRIQPDERRLYEETKRSLAKHDWADMNQYADAKTAVIEQILAAANDPVK